MSCVPFPWRLYIHIILHLWMYELDFPEVLFNWLLGINQRGPQEPFFLFSRLYTLEFCNFLPTSKKCSLLGTRHHWVYIIWFSECFYFLFRRVILTKSGIFWILHRTSRYSINILSFFWYCMISFFKLLKPISALK